MSTYRYTARDGAGKTVRSTIEAASRHEALSALFADGFVVTDLGEDAAQQPSEAKRAPRTSSFSLPGLRRTYKVSLGEKAAFCRQLAISVSAGVALRDSLESIAGDMDDPRFRNILRDVVERLHGGDSFSGALARHATAFDRLFVALIRSAEEAGSMAQTLEYLATSLEKSDRLNRKVRSITAYPIFIGGFFCVVCLVMTVFILPQFETVFSGFNTKLPLLTRVVFGANRFFLTHFVAMGLIVGALIAAFHFYKRSKNGRRTLDRMTLKMPFFGTIARKLAVARFCRNFAIMIRGGIPVATALEVTAAVSGNLILEEGLIDARERIMAGGNIAASLDAQGVFPRLAVRMISVGESSGRLPEVLDKISDTYEDQIEGAILMAMSLFEPVIICFFGMVVLVLVFAIYAPVFSVASSVK